MMDKAPGSISVEELLTQRLRAWTADDPERKEIGNRLMLSMARWINWMIDTGWEPEHACWVLQNMVNNIHTNVLINYDEDLEVDS